MSYGSDPDDFPELSADFWSDPDDYPELSEDYEAKESDTQKSKNNGARDRLSELPDSLILLILSFLPMRYVVRTSLLSKRWKDLWTTVPCLDFSDDENDSGKLQAFVNRTLIRWRGTKILKFKINLLFNMSLSSDIDFWVRFAMENEVEELYVSLIKERAMMIFEETGYWASQRLYSCSSIKKLSLLCCNLETHGNVHWDQLKSLRIDGVCLNEHVIDQVLSGTPQLEILMLLLRESNEDLNIQSSSLKRLTIEKYLTVDDNVATDTVLRIWAPNVETLVISGILYSKCMLMNVSSLTDATLGFRGPNGFGNHRTREAELLREMLREIFPTIHHVDKVTLSDWCIKELGVMEKKYLVSSSSSDVKFLKLDAEFIELDKIVDLLEIFSNLKMLVIDDTNHVLKEFNHEILYCQEGHVRERLEFDAENYLDSETNFPKSFLLQLRTVEITWFLCDTSIFPFIEFLLKHANMLEKMVIRARGTKSIAPKSLFLAAQKMLSMPRSSPTAKVYKTKCPLFMQIN